MSIGEKTRIQLPLVIGLVVTAVTITGLFLSIKNDVNEIKKHISADWTAAHMAFWVSEMRVENKTNSIYVPDIDRAMGVIR